MKKKYTLSSLGIGNVASLSDGYKHKLECLNKFRLCNIISDLSQHPCNQNLIYAYITTRV